jgi:hypothetical protein
MHGSARQAGYPSDSSRAARPQTRTVGRCPLAEARCSATTLPTNSATSATAPGRSATGQCRQLCTTPCLPGRRPHHNHPRPPQWSRRRFFPSPLPAAVTAGCGAPARDYSSQEWGTRLRHRPRPLLRAGAGATRAVAHAGPHGLAQLGLTVPARCITQGPPLGPPGRRTASASLGRALGART